MLCQITVEQHSKLKLVSFARSYDQIAGRSEQSIARATKCLPSCQRSEFETKILPPVDSPSGDVFSGYFFYATGKYVEKSYYYTYDWNSFVADVGGYMGLLLGHSLLSYYDVAKLVWKRGQEECKRN